MYLGIFMKGTVPKNNLGLSFTTLVYWITIIT